MAACTVYIGIGSNLDKPEWHTRQASRQLADIKRTKVVKVSSFYRSKPMGPQDQPDYINAVAALQTELEPLQLLDELQAIEADHGRVRTGNRWGPRTLDLDLLLYAEKSINSERLVVPHPGLHERAFVLYPLFEISPELLIPGKGSLADLIKKCPVEGLEKIIA